MDRPLGNLPVFVKFLRTGEIAIKSLQDYEGVMGKACPDTHFWCLGKDFCLPVFVRCNGVYDCPGHEDEKSCDVYTCPGFYRCRSSKVCVHVTHVCDDWPLCPQHDDDLWCDRQCPVQCTCHGMSFFCNQVFEAHKFTDIRYLDVRESGMSMHQLGDNHMLIHLSLAKCKVRIVSNVTFRNLHSLDLSDNLLTEVSVHHFVNLPSLTNLLLSGNPLTSAFTVPASFSTDLFKVRVLDLSHVKVLSVDPGLFALFPDLHTFNLSQSGVQLVGWNSFNMSVPSLQQLDLRGCLIEEVPLNFLKVFPDLRLLFTDDFKLCCPSVMPSGFDLNHCHVTSYYVSSCNNFLGSVTYRATVAVLATLALIGNVASLILRVCVASKWRLSSGGVLLTHLSLADLGTGLYLVTLALADRLLSSSYVWQDDTWRNGAVCHLAGVLVMCCRHAAPYFVTILTLDCCLHHLSVLTPRLTPGKVRVMCVLVWASSVLLASVPLIAKWKFYRQQALCIPLPTKRTDAPESVYAYVLMVLVHFVMFLLCSAAEVTSHVSSKIKRSIVVNKDFSPQRFQYVVFGSLSTGFLYTIACLVSTGSHTDEQKAIHTGLFYFGSVVSSAINPYLYMYGVRAERSERIKEKRLLMIVSRTRT